MASSEPSAAKPVIRDRVRSLRLPPASSAANSRLPWAITVILTALVVYLALGGQIPGFPQPLATNALPNGSEVSDSESPDGTTAPDTKREGNVATSGSTTAGSSTSAPANAIVLQVSGNIIPEQQILVSPQVSGRVIEIHFEAGQRVQKGFVLAILDSTEYTAEYERSLATVEAARQRMLEAREGSRPDEIRQVQAELAEAVTQLEQAERTLKRKQDLFTQKIVASQDLDDAKSQFDSLTKRVERLRAAVQLALDGPRAEKKRASEAELRQAEAELRRAKWRLDNTTIVAPITGTILKKNAELGNLVNPVAFNGSFSLCDIADLSKLEVELSVDERDIAKVFVGQRCQVRTDAYRDRMYQGYVSRLLPIADRAKSAIPVRVRLQVAPEEEGQYLRPEMRADVTFFSDRVDPQNPWSGAAPVTNAAKAPAVEPQP